MQVPSQLWIKFLWKHIHITLQPKKRKWQHLVWFRFEFNFCLFNYVCFLFCWWYNKCFRAVCDCKAYVKEKVYGLIWKYWRRALLLRTSLRTYISISNQLHKSIGFAQRIFQENVRLANELCWSGLAKRPCLGNHVSY